MKTIIIRCALFFVIPIILVLTAIASLVIPFVIIAVIPVVETSILMGKVKIFY